MLKLVNEESLLTPHHAGMPMYQVLPGPKYSLTEDEREKICALAEQMYAECYIGHIPWEQWLKMAAFTIFYQRGSIPH